MAVDSEKIYQMHIAEGFFDDCDELIRNCVSKYERVTYPVFVKVWKEMNMACLYQGRTMFAEIAELSEEVIQVAKEFLISNTNNEEELYVAVFLIYALLKLQPYPGFASLRICPNDIESIQRIEVAARKDKRLDVLYVLGTLLTEAQFHAEGREMGMESPLKKYFEGHSRTHKVKSHSVLRKSRLATIVSELSDINEQYVQMKMLEPTSHNMFYWDAAFADNVLTSFQKMTTSESGTVYNVDEKKDILESLIGNSSSYLHKSRMQDVKEMAMKSKVNPMRHLTGIEDRSPTESKEEINEEVDEVNVNKTKNISTEKQENEIIKHVQKKRKLKKSVMFVSRTSSTSGDETDDTKDKTNDVVIEYIDEAGVSTSLPDLLDDVMPDLAKTEVIVERVVAAANDTVTPANRKRINRKIKKIEKRDQKKTLMKSKFKKMGMLPMANFTEDADK